MDVTNSTAHDLQYRISSTTSGKAGKTSKSPESSLDGSVPGKNYVVVAPPPADSWDIQFFLHGKPVARKVVRSPKASVVLAEMEDGGYQAQASVAATDAFITYSLAEKAWAEKLDTALRENGVSTWIDPSRRSKWWVTSGFPGSGRGVEGRASPSRSRGRENVVACLLASEDR